MGCVLSGAGPSLLVVSAGNNLDRIKETISKTWLDLNVKSEIYTLDVEQSGAVVID